jgi:hypothetical protein
MPETAAAVPQFFKMRAPVRHLWSMSTQTSRLTTPAKNKLLLSWSHESTVDSQLVRQRVMNRTLNLTRIFCSSRISLPLLDTLRDCILLAKTTKRRLAYMQACLRYPTCSQAQCLVSWAFLLRDSFLAELVKSVWFLFAWFNSQQCAQFFKMSALIQRPWSMSS